MYVDDPHFIMLVGWLVDGLLMMLLLVIVLLLIFMQLVLLSVMLMRLMLMLLLMLVVVMLMLILVFVKPYLMLSQIICLWKILKGQFLKEPVNWME